MGLFLDDYLSNTSCFAEGNLLYIIYPFMPFGFYSMHCIIVRKKKKGKMKINHQTKMPECFSRSLLNSTDN